MRKEWAVKQLGDLILPCGTIDPTKAPDKPFRYVDVSSVSNKTFQIIETSEILGRDAPSRARRHIKAGDVLFATIRPTLKRIAIVPPQLDSEVCSTGYFVFRAKPNLDGKFLYYHLFTDQFMDAMERIQTGASYPAVNDTQVKEQKIAFPPLLEQKRIVAILDEAFEGIGAAVANAEKNLANARELFESYLNSVFAEKGKGWVEKSLGETCNMYQPKTIGAKDLIPDGPYPVFGANGIIGRYDKFNHEEPQLLVTCRGATCGSINVSEPKSWITGNAMIVRPKDHSLDLKFLEFAFRGGIDISLAITGAAQPQITRTNLSPLLICYPKAVSEQKRLASTFENLAEETKRLQTIYQQKLDMLAELKQSILEKAFTGELAAQPEKALRKAVA